MQFIRTTGMQKMLGGIMSMIFLAVLFLSLFHVSAGMDMSGNMSSCPFMPHEEVVCAMSSLDHLSAWQSIFTAVVPTIVLLLSAASAFLLVLAVAPNRLLQPIYATYSLPREVYERIYTFIYRPFQELFSRGILHPKLF